MAGAAMATWAVRTSGCAAAALVVLAGCASSQTASHASPSPATSSVASCVALACHMTRASDTYAIPLPDDARSHADGSAALDTMVASPRDLIAFYDAYMAAQGWKLVTAISQEPSAPQFTYKHIYCRSGAEQIDNVTVLVGPLTERNTAGLMAIGAQIELYGGRETLTACP